MALRELLDNQQQKWLIDTKYVSAITDNQSAPTQVLVFVVGLTGPIPVPGTKESVAELLGLQIQGEEIQSKTK